MASGRGNNNATIEKLRMLQARYQNDLAQKLDQIDAVWRSVDVAECSEDDLCKFHLLLHRLAGSGATFGFTEISEISRRLEDIVLKTLNENRSIDEISRREIIRGIDALRGAAQAPDPAVWENRSFD